MRRFSQRNSLVTLSEINITPLLDLAFVLLIIFVITRPLLEQTIDLQLPRGGKPDIRTNRRDIRLVEIKADGEYWMNQRRLTLPQLERELVRSSQDNPQMIVDIAADGRAQTKFPVALLDVCSRNRITRFTFRTLPNLPTR